MLVTRWQAPIVPDKRQILMMLEVEGLSPVEELFPSQTLIKDHRHPFDEVMVVAHGQMLLDINGNKLLLRAGDRILIPSNTKHSIRVEGDEECLCICARNTF